MPRFVRDWAVFSATRSPVPCKQSSTRLQLVQSLPCIKSRLQERTPTPHNRHKTRTVSLRHGAVRSWLDQENRPSHSSTAPETPSERPHPILLPNWCTCISTALILDGVHPAGSRLPHARQALFHRGPLAGVQAAPGRDRAVPFSWELWGMG